MLPSKYIRVLFGVCMVCPLYMLAQGIRIPAGAYVIANQGNIVTKNNWINNGTFTHNGGTVLFAGNMQQIIGTKSNSFNNLTILTGSNTTIGSFGHSLKGILKCDGILNVNNNFTLLANATQTALIDGSGAGDVLGNLTMQGYLLNGFGYKYLGSPFQSATVNEMSDEVNLTASFPSVYQHDENQASNGWITYTTAANALVPMRGYAFQLGNNAGAKKIDMNGVVTNRNVSLILNNNNRTYTKGFNLVSNPYPSPINWDVATGWTKTKIDNAIYYFDAGITDQYGGIYTSYINGISSNGSANNIIPAMQGFFVHVSDGTYPVAGTLGMTNATRITVPPQTYRQLNGIESFRLLRLRASMGANAESDAAVIYFQDTATEKFDTQLDALKLMNTTSFVPSLYTIAADAKKLSINALPLPAIEMRIPVGIQTMQDGQVSLFTTNMKALPADLFCYLYDAVTGIYQNVKENIRFQYYLPAGTYEQRFVLVFSRMPIVQQPLPTDPGAVSSFQVSGTGRNILLTLNIPSGERAVIRFINTAGQVLYSKTYTGSGNFPLAILLPQGIYQVVCYTANSVIARQIFIGE